MPLVYLKHNSARTRLNILIRKYEMLFDVLMWSVEAREAVFRHLKDETRPGNTQRYATYLRPTFKRHLTGLQIEDVEMLPMEKVRLVWKGYKFATSQSEQPLFQLQDWWRSNTHLPATVTFRFACG